MRSVQDTYGASTSNTPAENADAFNNALAAGRPFSVPDETYVCDAITTSAARVNMYGEGFASKIVTPKLRIEVTTDNYGSRIRDLSIAPVTSGAGTHGLEIITTASGGAFYEFELSGLYIDEFGEHGLCFDNLLEVEGFFAGKVRDSIIKRGFRGDEMGDSLVWDRLNLSAGSTIPFLTTHKSGARNCTLRDSTLATRGGGAYITGAEQFLMINNHVEHQFYIGNYVGWNGSAVVQPYTDGMVYLQDCYDCCVVENRVSAMHGTLRGSTPNIGAGYDIVNGGANALSNSVVGNSLGPSRYVSRARQQIVGGWQDIPGNINN